MSAVTTLPTVPTAARAGTATAADRVRQIANETAKGLRLRWAYRGTVIPELASGVVMYLMFQYFIGGGKILDDLVADTAPAMFSFIVGYGALMRMVSGLLEERNAGTLEQIHLSPLPAWQLAIGRLGAVITETLLIGTVATAVVLGVLGVAYPLDVQALVPLGLMVVGIAGFALLIAAASFTYPGIGALVHVIQMLIVAVNGMIVPVEQFPRWLELIANLAPTTLGVIATRRVLVDGMSLADLSADGILGWLLLHSLALVVAGWAAYQWQIRRSLRDGRLGP